MAADPARLQALAEAVADGRPLSWPDVESETQNDEDRALVRELRFLAGVAEAHKTAGQDASGTASESGPQRWGVLEIRERLGTGAFGSVYRAWDPRLAREVALKILHKGKVDDRQVPTLIEEGGLLARVRHPHIVDVYGADLFDAQVGIWMELVRGSTLEDLLRQQGPFSAREAASIGEDLCAALAAVHAAGLVHRDVKTQNVMREAGGRIVLMDFGAGDDARSVEGARGLAGTPVCMAPELFAGSTATPQSDLYSLGVLLFRIVTGRYPIVARTADDVRRAHVGAQQQRLIDLRADLPPAFVKVVERALSREPGRRFQSAGEMQAALSEVFRGSAGTEARAHVSRPTRPHRRRLAIAALALAAVAGVASMPLSRAIIQRWWLNQGLVTLAVLPLQNLTGDPESAHVVNGVSELMVSRLGANRSLVVMPPSSTERLVEDPQRLSLARNLGADYLLEGSVERTSGRLRMSVRLIEAGSGVLTWANTYDRDATDLFISQAEVAAAIASVIGVKAQPELPGDGLNRYTTSSEAQDAYLRGRYLLYRFDRRTLPEVLRLFEQAVALDPQFALAQASLARAYLMIEAYGLAPAGEIAPPARQAAGAAVALGPDLSEAHVAMGEVAFKADRDWRTAESSYERALQLAPNASTVRSPLARFLSAAGRPDEALEHAIAGLRADPLSAEMHASVGITEYYLRRFDDAVATFSAVTAAHPGYPPGFFGRARARSAVGDFRGAIADIERALELSGQETSYLAELARVHAAAGWQNMAEQILGSLLELDTTRQGSVAPQDLAWIYAALGDHDRALTLLGRAVETNHTRVLFLAVDPRADPVRQDRRFSHLLQAIGLEGR